MVSDPQTQATAHTRPTPQNNGVVDLALRAHRPRLHIHIVARLTGNDRIKKLREKHLYNDFKQKYNNNKNSTNSKIRKIPYIKNNSQKIMIANGYINNDCSNSINLLPCVK